MHSVYTVFVGKIKYICNNVYVRSEYKNNILKYSTLMYVLSVASVTLNKKRPKSLWWMEKKCFPFIIVFYIKHIRVQLVVINVYSYDGLCVSFDNKIAFWEEIILFWMQSFILQEKWGVLPIVCVFFWLVCRVLRVWGMFSENVFKQLRKTVNTFAKFGSLCQNSTPKHIGHNTWK